MTDASPPHSPSRADPVLDEFRAAGAFLEGHFVLSSGLHSPVFLQKMRVFEDPARTERLCRSLAAAITERFGPVDAVVAMAIGAIVPGYETARALGVRSLFLEREGGGFALRRGFAIAPHERVVVVEDVVSTGRSLGEGLAALADQPGTVVGAACLIDRSGGAAALPVELLALSTVHVPAYPADALPPALAALPATKPGSRPDPEG